MKICFWCDIHLPVYKNALQYDVLNWALEDVQKKNAKCVVFAGDVTCDGNEKVYKDFLSLINNLPMKTVYIPGNSDLRDAKSSNEIYSLSSPCKNAVENFDIYALNDAKLTICEEDLKAIADARENSIVFMHHPIGSLKGESREKMLHWRETHPKTLLFYAHCHKSDRNGCSVSLQAMDPDKSIGESPCITYYDTDSGELSKSYYYCPVPTDIYNYFGISCYKASGQVKYATEKGLKAIELRPGFLAENQEELKSLIDNWKRNGGENLSIHLPDVSYFGGEVQTAANYNDYIKAAIEFGANRFTQHVPKISVKEAREDKNALEKIAEFLGKHFDSVEHDIVIGIENMHMTQSETADDSRRFGYIPEECLEFMELVSKNCRHRIGINFDIGHARNNAPFSQKYQIGTWLSLLGKHIVGYHIHQVTLDSDGFHNHCGIDDVYGRLISYASFFKLWSKGEINKAPFVFEMTKEGAYDTTLATFEKHRQRKA